MRPPRRAIRLALLLSLLLFALLFGGCGDDGASTASGAEGATYWDCLHTCDARLASCESACCDRPECAADCSISHSGCVDGCQ